MGSDFKTIKELEAERGLRTGVDNEIKTLKDVLGLIDKQIKAHQEHYPKLSVYARAKHKHTIIILKELIKEITGKK